MAPPTSRSTMLPKWKVIANQILQVDPANVRALAIVTAIKQGQAQTPHSSRNCASSGKKD